MYRKRTKNLTENFIILYKIKKIVLVNIVKLPKPVKIYLLINVNRIVIYKE